MIWGYHYFWKHPYRHVNSTVQGLQDEDNSCGIASGLPTGFPGFFQQLTEIQQIFSHDMTALETQLATGDVFFSPGLEIGRARITVYGHGCNRRLPIEAGSPNHLEAFPIFWTIFLFGDSAVFGLLVLYSCGIVTYRFGVLYKDLSKFSGTILGGHSKALATPPKFNLSLKDVSGGLGFFCFFAFPFRSNFLWGAASNVGFYPP